MRLQNPSSAELSAVIFNALIIVALIPLALRGVRYRPIGGGCAATGEPGGQGLRPRPGQGARAGGKTTPTGRVLFIVGDPYLNVLEVNMALDHGEAG